MQCWCHEMMGAWLTSPAPGREDPVSVRRWQHECERAGADCAARLESVALLLGSSQVQRGAWMLWLRTDVATVEFADRVEPGIRHRYLGLVEALGEHLVWRQSGAAVQFLRVCPRSGRQYVFDDLRSALEAAAFSDTGKVEYEAMPKR